MDHYLAPGHAAARCLAAERAINETPSWRWMMRSFVRVTTPSGKTTSGRRAVARMSIAILSASRSVPSRLMLNPPMRGSKNLRHSRLAEQVRAGDHEDALPGDLGKHSERGRIGRPAMIRCQQNPVAGGSRRVKPIQPLQFDLLEPPDAPQIEVNPRADEPRPEPTVDGRGKYIRLVADGRCP